MDDVAGLLGLSSVRVELHRRRQEAVTATTRLRERRTAVGPDRAIPHADVLAPSAVRDAATRTGEPRRLSTKPSPARSASTRSQPGLWRGEARGAAALRCGRELQRERGTCAPDYECLGDEPADNDRLALWVKR